LSTFLRSSLSDVCRASVLLLCVSRLLQTLVQRCPRLRRLDVSGCSWYQATRLFLSDLRAVSVVALRGFRRVCPAPTLCARVDQLQAGSVSGRDGHPLRYHSAFACFAPPALLVVRAARQPSCVGAGRELLLLKGASALEHADWLGVSISGAFGSILNRLSPEFSRPLFHPEPTDCSSPVQLTALS
jgi:hypothetical protein